VLHALVSDLPRIGEWSPECEGVDWEGEVTAPVEGTAFVGHNAVGPGHRIRYSRHGTVLRAEPGRAFSFITDEGGRPSTVWSYPFEPLGEGRTRVTEGYEVRWIPTWARILDVPTDRHLAPVARSEHGRPQFGGQRDANLAGSLRHRFRPP
jgi:hypothetical protein